MRILFAIAAVVVAIGVAARINGIARKPFWLDETLTAIRLTGLEEEVLYKKEFIGRLIPASGMFPAIANLPLTTSSRLVTLLAERNPAHPPFFYLLELYWSRIFGVSPFFLRLLPVVFGLLAIPAIGWCAWEISGKAEAAFIASAFTAINPLFIAYSQEARHYSLWYLLTAMSTGFIFRGLRKGGRTIWICAYIATTMALYTSFFHLIFLAALSCAIFLSVFRERRKSLRSFTISVGAATLSFIPWLMVAILAREVAFQHSFWAFQEHGFLESLKALARIFVLWNIADFPSFSVNLSFPMIVFVMAAVFTLDRGDGQFRAYVLSIPLFLSLYLLFAEVVDTLLGTILLEVPRYGLACAVLSTILLGISTGSLIFGRQRIMQLFGVSTLAIICCVGTVMTIEFMEAPCWWTKQYSCGFIKDAQTINDSPARVLIVNHPILSGDGIPSGLALSALIAPDTDVLITSPGTARPDLAAYSRIWALNLTPSQKFEGFSAVRKAGKLLLLERTGKNAE